MKQFVDYERAFKQLNYTFKLNELNDAIEINGERITDITAAVIKSQMVDLGFRSRIAIQEAWTRIAAANQYNPLKEYFLALPYYDNALELKRFQSFITFERPIGPVFMTKFQLGAIYKLFDGAQNPMHIWDSRQGEGKSFLWDWLCPLPQYFNEGPLNPDSKDDQLRMLNHFFWEVSEFQATVRRADQEALKGIITQKKVTVRKPYGKHDIEKPVICSFIGTINDTGNGLLTDPTGNRRFLTAKIERIDHSYSEVIDKDRVWAEIFSMYKRNEPHLLTLAEQLERDQINSAYEIKSVVMEYFHKCYEIDPSKVGDWIPVSEMIDKMETQGLKEKQRIIQMELASQLKKAGCDKSNSNTVTGYGRQICYNQIREKIKIYQGSP